MSDAAFAALIGAVAWGLAMLTLVVGWLGRISRHLEALRRSQNDLCVRLQELRSALQDALDPYVSGGTPIENIDRNLATLVDALTRKGLEG